MQRKLDVAFAPGRRVRVTVSPKAGRYFPERAGRGTAIPKGWQARNDGAPGIAPPGLHGFIWLLFTWFSVAPLPAQTSEFSRVIEVAGKVEFAPTGQANWSPATNGLPLNAGDRLRTDIQSRAAIQLSDRSIVRLNERTMLEIQPAVHAEKRRFRLPFGSLFFFNRERPSSVEFETPLAAGAIRGTEFQLEAATDAMTLALLDGLVELQTPAETIALQSGEQVRIAAGQAASKTALVNAQNIIQWALYYPAVVNPDDLSLSDADKTRFGRSLELYRAGDLIKALAAAPEANDEAQQILRAALELSVGRVDSAEQRVRGESPAARALRELIGAVRGGQRNETLAEKDQSLLASAVTSSELLAHSYALQSRSQLDEALKHARQAAAVAPDFGIAHARVAELEFAFEHRRAALLSLKRALALSPRHSQAHALRGFVLLEQNDAREALESFEHALQLDAGLGNAWLGRGLALMHLRRTGEGLNSLQAAAALEPLRSLFRSYLGKAFSQQHETALADKDLRLARQLDPNDPTAWLYSALHAWQENRINEAVRDLERSSDLNDSRSIYRSQLLLDRDRAVRSANLAAIYNDAGLSDVSVHLAARSVAEDYANFSGHLFLANSYQAREDVNRFDLRLETARQSELLIANLLAPAGAGNLSLLLNQQEHLRFFEPRPIGMSSLTEYRSSGDWSQAGSVFGTVGALSYAVDTLYEAQTGQRANEDFERLTTSVQLKQQITAGDSVYLQVGRFDSEGGDLAQHYDPRQANRGMRVDEVQEPIIYLGWHHEWSPGNRTLLLLSRLADELSFFDPHPNVLFFRRGSVTSLESAPGFKEDFDSQFTLSSVEMQQIFQTPQHSLVVGGRYQHGDVESDATLRRTLSGVVTDQGVDETFERANTYAYGSWRVVEPLRLIAGVSYDRVTFPKNSEYAPLSAGEGTRDLLAPKAGLEFAPWQRGLLRASYTRSLGGLFFDNSVRLEPTQIAGFNQAMRSLIPESVAGLVPGTAFDQISVGFDQSFKSGTYFGLQADWLHSEGTRTIGIFTNSSFLPVPDAPSGTRHRLEFEEKSFSTYAAQLLGESFSVAARYRFSEANLAQRLPQIPNGTSGLPAFATDESARLHQVALSANFNHHSGVFAQWESVWSHQESSGYAPALRDEDLWQHNVFVGYRFSRRHAELRLGLLNLTDEDYRLNPLNVHPALPRERTFAASLRLNF